MCENLGECYMLVHAHRHSTHKGLYAGTGSACKCLSMCSYVCMHCTCVYTGVIMNSCVHTKIVYKNSTYTCPHACLRACIKASMHTNAAHVCMSVVYVFICMCVMFTCAYVYAVLIYIHVHMYLGEYICA